jgi:hypothetical protein
MAGIVWCGRGTRRHCEEPSDEAIHGLPDNVEKREGAVDCRVGFASSQ